MTTPAAPATEQAERKPELRPPADRMQQAPIQGSDSRGASMSPLGVQRSPLDPAHAMSLQRSAGNTAVREMVQRQPADAPPKPPKYKSKRPGKKFDEQPLDIPQDLSVAIKNMPGLMKNIDTVVARQGDRMRAKGFQPGIAGGSVSAGYIFARDAVFFFSGSGTLFAVETNLSKEVDPAKPKDLPLPVFALPTEDQILVSEPSRKRNWRVFARLAPETATDKDEDAEREVVGLDLRATDSKPHLPEGTAAGDLVVSVYAPWLLAGITKGIPQPGWKAEAGTVKDQPKQAPKWANRQYEKLKAMLAAQAVAAGVEGEDDAKGVGRKGTGEGGGGHGMGVGTGTTGKGVGAATGPAGKGRGADQTQDPTKPDKVVLWMGKHAPMLNVWKNGSHEAIPLKDGEDPADLKKRVGEAAAKQVSTGKAIADSAVHSEFVGGQGGAKATLEEILEASSFTANASAYPSKMEMQGGSGADVSPNGWGTTIAGAKHNFDMKIDYDARHFGLANQTFSRLGFIDYYWQLIDISGFDGGGVRAKGETESQDDFEKELRKQGRERVDEGKVRKVGQLEGFKETVSDVARTKWEDAKEDLWASKAQGAGLVALDAAWNIGKALISAWVTKLTEPENRREIAFGKQPGEYLVRCMANPQPNEDLPYDQQTRRATSIAVFPVRVVDVSARAVEVTQQDTTQLKQSRALVAAMEKRLAADPKNEGLQSAVRVAKYQLGLVEAPYAYSTVEKVTHELADFDKQISILERLATGTLLESLKGEESTIGDQLRQDVQKRFKKAPWSLVAWYEYEYHLHDVKLARKKKAEQKELTEKKAATVEPGTALRPRVTFVSEENGALVKMDMILGRAKGSGEGMPRWTLADVTTEDTARSYDGASFTPSIAGGDAEAIKKAFEAFCEKAEYGRGTISIAIPGRDDLVTAGQTMIMKPGEGARWRGRLKSLVEIAGLVAPYVKGGQLIGRLVAIAGALESAERLYDRAVNDRLKANFETLTDVVAMLAPMAHGATALAERLPMTSKGAYVLRAAAKGVELANEFMMPATFLHDLDRLMKDTSMGGPEKESAIIMLFGRGLRDGTVQYVKVKGPSRAGGEPLAHAGQELPPPTGTPTVGEGVTAREPGAPAGTPTGAPTPTGRPAPRREAPDGQGDVHGRFDTSDVTPTEPTTAKPPGGETVTPREPGAPTAKPKGRAREPGHTDVGEGRAKPEPTAEPKAATDQELRPNASQTGRPATPPTAHTPTVRKPWVEPHPDTLERHPDAAPEMNVTVEKGIRFDLDRMLNTMDATYAGSRVADRIRSGEMQLIIVNEISTGDAGLNFPDGRNYLAIGERGADGHWLRRPVSEVISTAVHEGSHDLDPAARGGSESPRGPSKTGIEAGARAFEYEHRQEHKLEPYDQAERAYRDAYQHAVDTSVEFQNLKNQYNRMKRGLPRGAKVPPPPDIPADTLKKARSDADKAMIDAMRADPSRYATETVDQEKARIEARRPKGGPAPDPWPSVSEMADIKNLDTGATKKDIPAAPDATKKDTPAAPVATKTDVDPVAEPPKPMDKGRPQPGKEPRPGPRPAESDAPKAGPDAAQPGPGAGSPAPRTRSEPRGRENREEQGRRAEAWQQDAATIEHGTRPDARAQARAAEFAPMFSQWTGLGPAGRKARLESLVNGHLAREGIPPVKIEYGEKPIGHAQFDAGNWTMTFSADAVNATHIDLNDFATLVDNAVHEGRHTVTTFRGIRVALSKNTYNTEAAIPGKVLGEAITANRRRHPDKELSEPARDEAYEIYKAQVDPEAPRGEHLPEGGVDREAVYARLDAANAHLRGARTLHDFNVQEMRRLEAENAQGTDESVENQRHLRESFDGVQQALRDQFEAHNEYVAMSEEIPSSRMGSAVKQALLERIALQARLTDSRSEQRAAAADRRAKQRRGDLEGAAAALERSRAAERRVRETQASLDGLVTKEPKLVEGRLVKHEQPLTQGEIERAPNAPTIGYPRRPTDREGPDTAAPRAAKAEPIAEPHPVGTVRPGAEEATGPTREPAPPAAARPAERLLNEVGLTKQQRERLAQIIESAERYVGDDLTQDGARNLSSRLTGKPRDQVDRVLTEMEIAVTDVAGTSAGLQGRGGGEPVGTENVSDPQAKRRQGETVPNTAAPKKGPEAPPGFEDVLPDDQGQVTRTPGGRQPAERTTAGTYWHRYYEDLPQTARDRIEEMRPAGTVAPGLERQVPVPEGAAEPRLEREVPVPHPDWPAGYKPRIDRLNRQTGEIIEIGPEHLREQKRAEAQWYAEQMNRYGDPPANGGRWWAGEPWTYNQEQLLTYLRRIGVLPPLPAGTQRPRP